jgi:hypothetical protein
MAYAFDNIMNLMQNDGGNEGDIFGGQSGEGQGQTGTGGLGTTTEGDLGPSGGGGAYAPATGQSTPETTSTGARNKLVQRNRDQASSPVDMGQITQNIGQAKDQIQNEANAYMQGATADYDQATGSIGRDVRSYVNTGLPGNPDTFNPYQDVNWMELYRNPASMVQDLSLETNTDMRDVDLLQNDAGLRELFRRQGDAEYRLGESALDAALLRGNQPFQLQRDDVLNSYRDLQRGKMDLQQNARQDAQSMRNEASNLYRQQVQNELRGVFSGLESEAIGNLGAFEGDMIRAEEQRRAELQKQAQAEIDRLIRSGTLPEDIIPHLRAGDNLNDYYEGNTRQLDYRDTLSGEQAGRFNRVLELLGAGGEVYGEGSMAGRSGAQALTGGFDQNRFIQDAIQRASLERDKASAAEAERQRAAQEEAARREANAASGTKRATTGEMEKVLEGVGKATSTATGAGVGSKSPGFLERLNPFPNIGQNFGRWV